MVSLQLCVTGWWLVRSGDRPVCKPMFVLWSADYGGCICQRLTDTSDPRHLCSDPRHFGPNGEVVRTIGPDTSVLGPGHFGTSEGPSGGSSRRLPRSGVTGRSDCSGSACISATTIPVAELVNIWPPILVLISFTAASLNCFKSTLI